MTNSAIDKIEMQIMWNRLIAVVEEQAQTLIRTAFSPTVREAGDLSAGVFDTKGNMLAQAVTGTPGHVNAMAASVGRFLEEYPLQILQEGDVLITNDPWDGTGHLNDFTVVTPTFQNESCIALFASTTHIADVGGLGFGPEGRNVYEEGIQIPITHLFRKGHLDETLMKIILANVRDPIAAEGDLYSLTACNRAGGIQLLTMMQEFGLPDLCTLGSMIINTSRDAMLEELGKLPKGEYRSRMRIDGYNQPVDLICALTITNDEIAIDFAGTSKQSSFGINVPITYTQAYASFGVRCVIGNDIPNNAGSISVIRVTAPKGSLLNAPRPAAVSARHAIGQMLPDLVLGCLAEPLEWQVSAQGAGCLWLPVIFGGPGVAGEYEGDPGPEFVINPFHSGGTGARPTKDGLSTTAFPSGVKNTPVEVNEATAPIIIWQKEYLTDSGGAGKFRGGLGQIMEFGHSHGAPFVVSRMFDRIDHPAEGFAGGQDGGCGKTYISDGHLLPGKGRDLIPAGESFFIETPGGAGIGDPAAREPEMVHSDLRDGLISEHSARDIYRLAEK